MEITNDVTPEAALNELGQRLAARRLGRNLTQAAFARAAGVSKSTVERLEAGQSTQLSNWLRVLRALDLLAGLDSLVLPPAPSPIAELRSKGKRRRRASAKAKPGTKPGTKPGGTWTWGDS